MARWCAHRSRTSRWSAAIPKACASSASRRGISSPGSSASRDLRRKAMRRMRAMPGPAIRPPNPKALRVRTFNFSPGPAVLPTEVLEQARDELLDWNGSGMSVMEVSHRGKAFLQVAADAEADLRELLAVPRNYKVLFVQGGASAQFSVVPL